MTRKMTKIPKDKLEEIQKILLSSKHILVVSHLDPDGDAIGSVLAFGEYLRECGLSFTMVRESEIPEKYRFFPSVEKLIPLDDLPPGFSCDTAIVLECPDPKRMGQVWQLLDNKAKIINIDHHTGNADYGVVNWVVTSASSVGEMVYEYFMHVGYKPNYNVGVQLYTAILTDTGRFRYESTSPRTLAIAGELVALGINSDEICREIYYNQSPACIKLLALVLNTIEFHAGGTVCVLTLKKQMYIDAGACKTESDGIVDYAMQSRGVLAGALLKEVDENTTRVSLRCVTGVDVSEVARKFGGGGHVRAAGCSLDKSVDDARDEIVSMLAEATRVVSQSV